MHHPDLRRLHPLLKILADGHFHSGQQLGEALGVSRTAVWKKLQLLEDVGLDIQAVSGKGYRLSRPLELLQREQITAHLTSNSQTLLNRLEILPVIDSTNRYLADRPGSGQACFAEYQLAGRGRRGRAWHSPFAANICFSLTWYFDDTASTLSGLSLAAGVWIAEALQRAGITGIGLKWPNDVLYSGHKLAGVLIEMKGETAGPCQTVIGIGLNVDMAGAAAESIDQAWTDIRTITGQRPERNRLAGLLLHHLLTGLSDYQVNGLATVQARWNELDCMAGRNVQLHHPSGILTGTAHGIDETGALQLRCKDGVHSVHSGEVSLRPAAPARQCG